MLKSPNDWNIREVRILVMFNTSPYNILSYLYSLFRVYEVFVKYLSSSWAENLATNIIPNSVIVS